MEKHTQTRTYTGRKVIRPKEKQQPPTTTNGTNEFQQASDCLKFIFSWV